MNRDVVIAVRRLMPNRERAERRLSEDVSAFRDLKRQAAPEPSVEHFSRRLIVESRDVTIVASGDDRSRRSGFKRSKQRPTKRHVSTQRSNGNCVFFDASIGKHRPLTDDGMIGCAPAKRSNAREHVGDASQDVFFSTGRATKQEHTRRQVRGRKLRRSTTTGTARIGPQGGVSDGKSQVSIRSKQQNSDDTFSAGDDALLGQHSERCRDTLDQRVRQRAPKGRKHRVRIVLDRTRHHRQTGIQSAKLSTRLLYGSIHCGLGVCDRAGSETGP
jgi:hypothetical protein